MGTRVLWVCSIWCGAAALAAGFGIPEALAAPPAGGGAGARLLPGSTWTARAARHMAEREYRASANEHGLQAPNRRHNLRTYFEPTGIRVHDRTAPGEPRLLSLELVGVGRGNQLAVVPPGRVVSHGPRVEIRRRGLVEWYLNSPEGLEQGFTLARRPAGDRPLVLVLALSGSRARLAGPNLRIEADTGRRLAYGDLTVEDADGRAVEAHFETSAEDRITIVVDDRGARYPLTIDPLLTGTADTQLESDQAGAFFGTSVAGAGDVNGDGYADVIVGAEEYDAGQFNEGAAFLFLGSASGIADSTPATADTQLEGDQSGALFGTSVAGAGDVNGDGFADVIIGAQEYDAGQFNEGAAFVFLGSASGIADGNPSTADTQLESDQIGALLGGSVAGAGDVDGDGYADVIVGAEEWNGPTFDEGAAFVFLGSAVGIPDGNPGSAAAQIESDQLGALLGGSVAGAGDVNGDGFADVIVGAELYNNGQTDEGAAFLFLGSASGIASGNPGSADALLESNQVAAFFGGAVAGAGDVNGDGYSDAIVGANLFDNKGAAFLFLGSAGGVASGTPATAFAQLESNQSGATMGAAVAGAGDVNGDGSADVIVGAELYDIVPNNNEGAAFIYLPEPSHPVMLLTALAFLLVVGRRRIVG